MFVTLSPYVQALIDEAPDDVRETFSNLITALVKRGALPDESDLSIEPLEDDLPHAFTIGFGDLLASYQVIFYEHPHPTEIRIFHLMVA